MNSPEVTETEANGVRGVCPNCRRQEIVAIVDATEGTRIQHGQVMEVCKTRGSGGPTYYLHPAQKAPAGGDDE